MGHKLTREAKVMLDASGVEYTIEEGTKHMHIYVGSEHIGTLSKGSKRSRDLGRIRSAIRRLTDGSTR